MKGAQNGASAGVLTPLVGYIISEDPANMLFMTGHADLTDEAMVKLDQMIDNCGIRHLIRPSTLRARNSRTGDTNKTKEYAGGTMWTGSATNHNLLRQRDVRVIIVDDFDAAKMSSKDAGSTMSLIEQRSAAYAHKRKLALVSTPQILGQSNIHAAYLLGDQRKYHIPCPCCGAFIKIEWEILIENSNEKAGVYYKLDETGRLVRDSVGYVCPECAGFFNDRKKQEFLEAGMWRPTAQPVDEGYHSYHISSLYAPVGMFDWTHYVGEYLKANPVGQEKDSAKMKTFTNVVLGLPYEEETLELKASEIQANQRDYRPNIIPEKMSEKDGNGKIITLTLGCDLNGKEDDARLDWEVVGWSESGSSYSISHGSIGTFVPKEKTETSREKWTYRHGVNRSVWAELDAILAKDWPTDTGRKMRVFVAAIDVGYMSEYAYPYVEKSRFGIYAVKGDVTNRYTPYTRDAKMFKAAKERSKMYILESNLIKDELAKLMSLKWDDRNGDAQPVGFMNFPKSEDGKYQYTNFFSHFEAEKRMVQTTAAGEPTGTKWVKKDSSVQNHLFDCRCYNMAIRGILLEKVGRELKANEFTWNDYADVVLGRV
jgi:phage terminase large subunit GpA-like protein